MQAPRHRCQTSRQTSGSPMPGRNATPPTTAHVGRLRFRRLRFVPWARAAAAATLTLTIVGAPAQVPPQATAPPVGVDARHIVEQVCSACHGADGNSKAPNYPVLAQQGAPYLHDQLVQFAAQGRRPDGGVMGAFALSLTGPEMESLADYFSRQALTPRSSTGVLANPKGESIFYNGIVDHDVPACASCHGVRGEGLAPRFPRLAGQHAAYLATQLRRYRAGTRISDREGLMRHVAAKLSDADIEAVADYAAAMR